MHVKFRNVNAAFRGVVSRVARGEIATVERSSRNGAVLRIDEPVIVTYHKPWERVLFSPVRDCNPFFHLYESLWMLAGRNDVEPLAYYNSNIDNYSDDGKTFHGAYGHRWRRWFSFDQLTLITEELKTNHDSRRVVLGMWDSREDLLRAIEGGKDVPCNTHAYFEIKDGLLEMTVCNRSNDLVWGMFGANVVHFSFLQEYLAGRLGVDIGNYHQFTNNLHIYKNRWEPEKYLDLLKLDHYSINPMRPIKLVGLFDGVKPATESVMIDLEIESFVDEMHGASLGLTGNKWHMPFLRNVAHPMMKAFYHHKERDYDKALWNVNNVFSEDWKIDAKRWILKRRCLWMKKQK